MGFWGRAALAVLARGRFCRERVTSLLLSHWRLQNFIANIIIFIPGSISRQSRAIFRNSRPHTDPNTGSLTHATTRRMPPPDAQMRAIQRHAQRAVTRHARKTVQLQLAAAVQPHKGHVALVTDYTLSTTRRTNDLDARASTTPCVTIPRAHR